MYERAHGALKSADDKEERLMLLESWKQFEVSDLYNFLTVLGGDAAKE